MSIELVAFLFNRDGKLITYIPWKVSEMGSQTVMNSSSHSSVLDIAGMIEPASRLVVIEDRGKLDDMINGRFDIDRAIFSIDSVVVDEIKMTPYQAYVILCGPYSYYLKGKVAYSEHRTSYFAAPKDSLTVIKEYMEKEFKDAVKLAQDIRRSAELLDVKSADDFIKGL